MRRLFRAQEPTPPKLSDLVGLAKGIAAVLGQELTGGDYGEPALSELRAGEDMPLIKFSKSNPAVFAHTVIDWYVLATGDFLHGTAEVARERHNLTFSSAAVARSACEYASVGWWLADRSITVRDRIARTASVVYESIQEGKKLRSSEQLGQYQTETQPLLDWALANRNNRQKLAGPTRRLESMNIEYGKLDYAQYSSVAHGDLIITAQLVGEKIGDLAEDPREPLWRVLLACEYSLKLAERVSELRSRRVDVLPGLAQLHNRYGAQFDQYNQYLDSQDTTDARRRET
jgi:hypothetical protein